MLVYTHHLTIVITYDCCAARQINLSEVLPTVPLKVGCEIADLLVNPIVASKLRTIGVEHNFVGASLFNTDSVVGKTLL